MTTASMPIAARAAMSIGLLLLLSSGCGRIAFTPSQNNGAQAMQQQMQTLAQQAQEYQTRAASLDKDNQELETLLAQSRQQIQLLNDEVTATRQQLKTTTDQFLAVRENNTQLQSKTSALMASVEQRAGAEIRANNSLLKNLAITNIPGATVRQDGDVVRVELAADQLFMPGSPQVKGESEQLIQSVAAELRRNFSNQIIGIEGHTDDQPTHSQQFPTNHHLSVAQALAVYNSIVQRGTIAGQQLFVIGHGANHPVVSNATDSGKARNRRIELVVYPEGVAQR
jgi:flagellar motor protein MotB